MARLLTRRHMRTSLGDNSQRAIRKRTHVHGLVLDKLGDPKTQLTRDVANNKNRMTRLVEAFLLA